MSVSAVLEKWRLKEKNKQASIDLWNSMAQEFGEHTLPTFEDNSFLKLLQKKDMLGKDALVLDVGCGTGKYAIAIADRCKAVTGIDFSPNMIELAKQKAAEHQTGNVDFFCGDWHNFNLRQSGFEKKFDLVFAHMTPAVQSADTFDKLSLASRGWCVLAKPTRRIDPVSDAVKGLVGINEKRESSDTDLMYAFELLWQQGCLPYFEYEKQCWHMQKTLDQSYALYINRVKTYRDISSEEEEQIKQYLQSIANDGVVSEDVDTTIATLYWHV
jgi:SAM-dependent methyltransferase